MGRIHISSVRSAFESKSTFVLPDSPLRTETQHTECIEHVDESTENVDKTYPIASKNTKDEALPFIAADEVRRRNGRGGTRLWIVVEGIVIDATEYQHQHPGGRSIITSFGGQDCSWQWRAFHDRQIWRSEVAHIRVGRTKGVPNPFVKPPSIIGLRKHGFQDFD